MPDASVWEDIRRAYEDHSIKTTEILKIYDITQYALDKRRDEEFWPRRPSIIALNRSARWDTAPVESSPSAEVPAASRARPAATQTVKRKLAPIAQRRGLVQRLYAVIDAKLNLLERRFALELTGKNKLASSADTERDTRAIGILIKNLEQVTAYDDGQTHGKSAGSALKGAAAKSAALAATQLADEADRIRRELGERLQRFVDTAQSGPV